jgi:integrase
VYVEPLEQTLGHYLREEWLPARKPKQRQAARGHRGQVSLHTWATNRMHLEAYVIPRIGPVPLQRITVEMLDALYDDLEESGGGNGEGLSATTVLHVHRTLHKALKDAVKRGKLTTNVAAIVDAPKASRARTETWDVGELRTFLERVRDDRVFAAWLLFATTGMRRGEVAGLALEDLDLDRARLQVDWTLGVVDNEVTWKPRPKSKAGERVMALDPATVKALRQHLARQAERRLVAGPAWKSRQYDAHGQYRDDCIFTWDDGTVIGPERYSVWFRQHCRAAKLRRIRLHDLRHVRDRGLA